MKLSGVVDIGITDGLAVQRSIHVSTWYKYCTIHEQDDLDGGESIGTPHERTTTNDLEAGGSG